MLKPYLPFSLRFSPKCTVGFSGGCLLYAIAAHGVRSRYENAVVLSEARYKGNKKCELFVIGQKWSLKGPHPNLWNCGYVIL